MAFLVACTACVGLLAASELPAHATPAIVQHTSCTDAAAGSTVTCAFSNFVGQGNFVAVFASWDTTSSATIDDNQATGAWTARNVLPNIWDNSPQRFLNSWYLAPAPANIFSATITFGSNVDVVRISMVEVSGTNNTVAPGSSSTGTSGLSSPHPENNVVTKSSNSNVVLLYTASSGALNDCGTASVTQEFVDNATCMWTNTAGGSTATTQAHAVAGGKFYGNADIEISA